MSKNPSTDKKTNAKGSGTIEDPPEVTDIVIVSNPPPNPIGDGTKRPKKAAVIKLSKEGKLLVTVENIKVKSGDIAFVIITQLTPKPGSGEPKPDPRFDSHPIIANFVTMVGTDTAEFMTDSVPFKSKLIIGGKYTLKYFVFCDFKIARDGKRSAEVIA